MIDININIRNPFSNRFSTLFYLGNTFGKSHKAWEIQAIRTSNVLTVELRYTIRQDHAGLWVALGILGFEISGHIYDTRHWDDANDCWNIYQS